jgi:uncharacterized protein (TIGR00251 family)
MSEASAWTCLRVQGEACVLDVSVVPNARRTAVDGLHDGALRVRLAAPPVDGKANQCLIDWLAAELGCPKRAISLLRGPAARRKQVLVNLPVSTVAAWLDAAGLPLPR